jgi:hypothetical protein
MRHIFLLEFLASATIAVMFASRGMHPESYVAGVLMLFCLWMYNRTRLR